MNFSLTTVQVNWWAALIGGFLSFLSPCIFPLLPGFLAFLISSRNRKSAVWRAFAFSLGLTVIFVLLGIASGTFGMMLSGSKRWIELIGGIIVIVFGLSYAGLFTLPFFEKGIFIPFNRKIDGFWSAFLFGIVTSFAWTPCIGPTLGAILTIAATGNSLNGGVLLTIFSVGIMIPLILAALLVDFVNKIMPAISKYQRQINIVGGIILIIVGFLMVIGKLGILTPA
ncbi:cytochrome c biogenesis CcdA family protein [Mesoaciditoga sp.]